MATETVTVGISYTSTDLNSINYYDTSIFSWTVTEVLQSGTFVDGNPWVVVGSGAQLVDIVPKSVQKTSGHTHSYYPNIVNVWTSGSAKNPNTFHRTNKNDPTGLLGISAPAGTTGSKKIVFDQRAIINVGEGTQAFLDAQYDVNSNIGIPGASGNTVPIGLTGGDVIVTADSVWYDGLPSDPLFARYGVVSSSVVNAPKHWTTGIKRFGVLTVLKEAPTEACFRPPLQWIPEEPQTRPTPIPLRAAISLTAIDAILGQTFSGNQNAALHNGSSPIFHDGHDTYFSSSNGVHGIRARSTPTTTNETYFGTASLFLANLLFDMTRTSAGGTAVTNSNRTICRNRIIQYAIDAYGSVMMLSKTNSTAGQRPAEIKPWLMLGGFLLGGSTAEFGGDLINFHDRLKTKYAGTALANLSYTNTCKLLFNDDLCCVPVISGPTLGGPNSAISQIWGPGLTHSVVNATQGTTAWVADSYYVVENGNFANLKVTGFNIDRSTAHIAKHLNYYNSFVKVFDGPGASNTIYRVLSVNTDGGGPLLPKDEVRLDRPWSNGFPDSTSTIKLFPFRNGAIENTSWIDLGRYVYAVNGTDPTYIYYNNNSPIALGYGQICFKAYLPYYSALKALRDKTGDSSYVLGETWKWLADVIDGSGLSVIDYATRYGKCPDSDRWNLIWDDVTSPETNSSGATYASNYFGFPSHNYNTIKGWLRNTVGSDGEYGERHLNRLFSILPSQITEQITNINLSGVSEGSGSLQVRPRTTDEVLLSQVRTEKFSSHSSDGNIQFWTATKLTQLLQLDKSGNLCFGSRSNVAVIDNAHIPPPTGTSPMYSARAFGHIVVDTGNTAGTINTNATTTKNVSNVVWESKSRLKVTFERAMPSDAYVVVANSNSTALSPLIVCKGSGCTETIMYLDVYYADPATSLNSGWKLNGTAGSGTGPLTYNGGGYPELLDFVVFA